MSKVMNNSPITVNTSEILIYQAPDGTIRIDVRLENETVWLSQDHMAQLFGKSKKTISEHIRNIFNEGELDEQVVIRKFRTTTRWHWRSRHRSTTSTVSRNVKFNMKKALRSWNRTSSNCKSRQADKSRGGTYGVRIDFWTFG